MEKNVEEILTRLKNLDEELRTVKEIVTETREIVDPLILRIDSLETKYMELSEDMSELREENRMLKNQIETMEQYSRKNNVIIQGIPQTQGEDVRKIVKTLGEKLEIKINESEVAAAHRLPVKRDTDTPPIIVKFLNHEIKPDMIAASKKKRLSSNHLGYSMYSRIFCDEHLTQLNKQIFLEAKKLQREGLVKFVWTNNNIVRIRRDENSPKITINSIEQLSQWREINNQGTNREQNTPKKKRTAEERSPRTEDNSNEVQPNPKKKQVNTQGRINTLERYTLQGAQKAIKSSIINNNNSHKYNK